MHASRFPSRSLPILEPSPRGKHDRFYDLLSRLLSSPRQTSLGPASVPYSLVRRVQLLAPLYGVYTSRSIFRPLYATPHSDAALPCATKSRTIPTRTANRLVNHRTSQRTRSFPSTVHPLPANFKVTSGAIFCRIREIASRLGTIVGGRRQKTFDYHSRRTISSQPPVRENESSTSSSGTCLVTKAFRYHERARRASAGVCARAPATRASHANDRLVKIEKSLAGCLSSFFEILRRLVELPIYRHLEIPLANACAPSH